MSLWTPGGEHEVPRSEPTDAAAPDMPGGPSFDDLSPEQRAQAEQLAAEMSEVRQQLMSAPAAVVVANHAMGLYELAAIHLSAEKPNLEEARVAIDAFGALVDTLGDRLGEDSATLQDALGQIRLAYVQVKGALEGAGEDSAAEEPATDDSPTG
ncbi:MAG TPA: hypothetical protein VFN21_09265 [Acidimicrobiales bacterium]|nr:hypothetical protein [Acidimicrobiales bacterium]